MAIFKKLFEPITLGSVIVKNRIVMPPMTTEFGNPDSTVSDRICNYYQARARGGVGLVVVQEAAVTRGEKDNQNMPGIWGDEFLPGLKKLANVIKGEGSLVFLQIGHPGRHAMPKPDGSQAVAPSSIPGAWGKPRELTVVEIHGLVADFAQAVERARSAGFDGVEYHAAHVHLMHQFLSPLSNKRDDEYGGSVERRARFVLEVLQASRKKVGKDFPISVRINGDDFVEGGLTPEQSVKVACLLQEAGATCIHVSAGTVGSFNKMTQPSSEPQGGLVHLAAGIKKAVNIPVITVGRITDAEFADRVLAEGKADLVAMGRALIADPELVNKIKGGRLDDIRRCIGCCHCLGTGTCTVNPTWGREDEGVILPARKAKNVVVIGGGPGGMEAARIAASRGHRVTLYEENERLGGQLLLAAIPPYKGEIANFTEFLATQVRKTGVKVLLGESVTAEKVRSSGADIVILATGSRPCPLNVPGADRSNVVQAREVVSRVKTSGKRVAVIGGGQVGCETALLLQRQGKDVTIIEILPNIAADMKARIERHFLMMWLREAGIKFETECKVEVTTEQGVVVSTPRGGRTIEADTVVVAVGAVPNNEIAEGLKNAPFELHIIGDAFTPRAIADAVRDGFDLGRTI